jgi:hypothetical protein
MLESEDTSDIAEIHSWMTCSIEDFAATAPRIMKYHEGETSGHIQDHSALSPASVVSTSSSAQESLLSPVAYVVCGINLRYAWNLHASGLCVCSYVTHLPS